MKFFTAMALFGGISSVTALVPPKNYGAVPYSYPYSYPAAPTTTKAATTTSSSTTSSSTTSSSTTSSSTTSSSTTSSSTTKSSTTSSSTTAAFSRPTAAPTVCLTNTTANYLVNGFASLLTAYNNDTAEALLASDFTDTSDSINFLAGYPLGSVTFPSKAAFEAGQGSQPAIGFTVTSIDAITCNTLAFRWVANVGGSYPIKGIDIFYASNLNNTDAGWQIKTVYGEFNSGSWMIDIGGTCAFTS